ncbi:MAG: glycosyltransferase family 2 protein [Acidimicrobiales bacterium]
MTVEAVAGERVLVTVVLPCLDEEVSVGQCVDEASAALDAAGYSGEILVVDNNSTDRSVEIARAHGARVVREQRPGYGRALRTGIEHARGEIVVMADADLTYDLSKIARLVQPVADGKADIVLGERLSEAPSSTMPFLHRRVGTPMLTMLVRRAAQGLRVTDSQSGYRAFRRDAILELGLTSTGMEFASEMLILAGRARLRVSETSTGYRPRAGVSKLNTFSDGWRHVRQILLLAPHLMLVTPGLVLMAFGAALEAVGLVDPSGLAVGSLRWQPSFISGIALIIGVQALIAGFVLSERQRAVTGRVRHRRGHKRASLPATCLVVGLAAGVAGIAIDAVLFVLWIHTNHSFSRAIPLAALAQSFVIDGTSLAGFGLIYPIVVRSALGASDEVEPESDGPFPAAGPRAAGGPPAVFGRPPRRR